MVQKGKLAQSTCFLVKAVKRVDFPTFGKPTIPTFSISIGSMNSIKKYAKAYNFIDFFAIFG
jgi:hypothetical protein